MLESNLRYILYFDLAMVPYPSDAPPLPLDIFAPHLLKRCNEKRDLKLSVSKTLPQSEGMTFLERVKAWGHDRGYAAMRVRWRDPDKTKPQSAKVDTARVDAGEALFVKTAEVSLKAPLPEISQNMSNELITAMQRLLD